MGSRIIVPGYFGDKGLGFDPLVRRGLKYLNFMERQIKLVGTSHRMG